MKLTADQRESLYELTFCTGRPTVDTARLVELGLVEQGKGRFGFYVRITAKGRALTNTWSSTNSDMTSDRGDRAASGVLAAAKGESISTPVARAPHPSFPPPVGNVSGVSSAPNTSDSGLGVAGNSRCVSRGAVPRRGRAAAIQAKPSPPRDDAQRRHQAPSGIAASGSVTYPDRSRRCGNSLIPPASTTPLRSAAICRETSNASNAAPSPLSPNAVRVVLGTRCVFYPLGMFETLHGTKQRCYTAHRFYRTYALAASDKVDIVF